MTRSKNGFDAIGVVTDWLDTCRAGRLDQLISLYDDSATLECVCTGITYGGHAALAEYWRTRIPGSSPTSFTMDEIRPDADGGVTLDYQSFEGKPVVITFTFNDAGKIQDSRCAPKGACAT